MKKLIHWLVDWTDERTGVRDAIQEGLYENIPGGSRWRYITGSMLVFAFVTQVVTGIFLWMSYSAGIQNAWASVFYIQNIMPGGWLLRGIHHVMAQAMVVLMPIHMLQVIVDKAYQKPREINFWLGLVLMLITLGLGLTGYLLPWDQLAIWAITVGSNMARATPFLGYEGPGAQLLTLGGIDMITNASDARFGLLGARFVGEETLNRFYVLHCIAIPLAAAMLMAIHFWRVRKDGGISAPL